MHTEYQAHEAAGDDAYIVISGNGRSGSNRLLDIFDANRWTACRSEVNNTRGSEFFGIGGTLFEEDLGKNDLAALRTALARAKARRSGRDRLDQPDKAFLTKIGGLMLRGASHRPLRRALSAIGIMRHPDEWAFPAACFDRLGISDTRLVVKLNACPGWAAALTASDPNCLIVHNIRDPREYLQSWYNRFVLNGIGTTSFEDAFGDVPRILSYFGRSDAETLRQPTEENLVEVELWRWRFINERLQSLAALTGRYVLVTYAEIDEDPTDVAQRLFAFAGLPFDGDAKTRIGAMRNTLFSKPHASALDDRLCRSLIGKVLEDSPLRKIEALRLH